MSKIIELIENLRTYILSKDIGTIKASLNELNINLSKLSYTELNTETIDCLVQFYIGILNIHFDLLKPIFDGLNNLIDFVNFSDENAKYIADNLVTLTLQDYKQVDRISGFRILDKLFRFHSHKLKELDAKFIQNFLTACDSERSVEGVYLVMKINAFISRNLQIKYLADELFESISIYFPLDVKAKKDETISPNELRVALKSALIGSPYFGRNLLPLLLEKCAGDIESEVIDSLDILGDAIPILLRDDFEAYYRSFLDALYNVYSKSKEDFMKVLAEKCLSRFGEYFELNFSDSQIEEVSVILHERLSSIYLEKNESSLEFLIHLIQSRRKLWKCCIRRFIPNLVENILKSELRDLSSLEYLNKLLFLGIEYPDASLLTNEKIKKLTNQSEKLLTQLSLANSITNENEIIQICLFFDLSLICSVFGVVDGNEKSLDDFIQSDIIDRGMHLLDLCVTNCDVKKRISEGLGYFIKSKKTHFLHTLSHHNSPQLKQETKCHLFAILSKYLQADWLDEYLTLPISSNQMSSLMFLTKRFADHNEEVCDKLCEYVLFVMRAYLDNNEDFDDDLSRNIALVISELGFTKKRVDLLDYLIDHFCSFYDPPDKSFIIWFCTLIGSMQLKEFENKSRRYLIDTLYAMCLSISDRDQYLIKLVHQTYASLVNKLSNEHRDLIQEHARYNQTRSYFICWMLRGAMLAGAAGLVDTCVGILTDETHVNNETQLDAVHVLFDDLVDVFHYENRVFPNSHPFYQQQLYFVLATRYQKLANQNPVAMKMYVRLCSYMSQEVLNGDQDNVISTIISSLSPRRSSVKENGGHGDCEEVPESDSTDLYLSALNLLTKVDIKHNTAFSLDNTSDIVMATLTEICGLHGVANLTGRQRLQVTSILSWFMSEFPDQDTVKWHVAVTKLMKELSRDPKKELRLKEAQLRLLMF